MPSLKELSKQLSKTYDQLRECEDEILRERRRTKELDAANDESRAESRRGRGF